MKNEKKVLIFLTEFFKYFITWANIFRTLSIVSLFLGVFSMVQDNVDSGSHLIGGGLLFGFFFSVLDKLTIKN